MKLVVGEQERVRFRSGETDMIDGRGIVRNAGNDAETRMMHPELLSGEAQGRLRIW